MKRTKKFKSVHVLKYSVLILSAFGICSFSSAGEARPERWRWSNPSPHGNNVLDMNVSADVAVQVGDAGAIHVQRSDGRWAPVSTGYENYMRSTAMLGERIIVTGESGIILWSDDGVEFQSSELSPVNSDDWFEGVCTSSQRAVAVGDFGAVYSSTNGINWSGATRVTSEWLRGVAFGASTFVAVGEGGTILKAPITADTWSSINHNLTTAHLNRVRYLGGTATGSFYAVGNNGILLSSSNGASWELINSGTTNHLYDIAMNNSGLLLVGDEELSISTDGGTTWVDQIDDPVSNAAPAWIYLSAYGKGNSWSVAGRTGLFLEGTLNAGSEYSWQSSPSDSSRAWLWDMTELNGIRVAVGDLASIQTSLDGILWAREAVPVPSTNTVLLGVGGNSNMLVAVGNEGHVLISLAGLTEMAVTNNSVVTNIMVDTFGVIWTNLPSFTTNLLQGIDANDDVFITCGQGGSIFTSPNGTTWTAQSSGSSYHLSSVAIGSNGCVAVGSNGALLLGTADGLNWSSVASGTTDWIYRVRWLENQFVAVGENGRIMISPDGSNWTSRTSGTSTWLSDVTYLEGRWYVSGYHGTLLTSPDLITWTQLSIPTGKSLFAVNAYDGQLLLAGAEGVLLRNQVVADTTPVQLLDYGQSISVDSNAVETVYEVFLFGGEPDQFFDFHSASNLTDNAWINVNGTLELYDPSGTLYAIRTRDATNSPAVEYYTTLLAE